MLQTILKTEIQTRGVSVREAARQIRVAHTTLLRVLQGDQIDLETLTKICNWLGVSPAIVLNFEYSNAGSLADELKVFLANNPELEAALSQAIRMVENLHIKRSILDDLLAYITFRISISNSDPGILK